MEYPWGFLYLEGADSEIVALRGQLKLSGMGCACQKYALSSSAGVVLLPRSSDFVRAHHRARVGHVAIGHHKTIANVKPVPTNSYSESPLCPWCQDRRLAATLYIRSASFIWRFG